MVLGLPFWVPRMQRRHVLIWGPFAVYAAMWAFIFVGEARYHIPLLPIFTLLAAIGAAAFVERVSSALRKGGEIPRPPPLRTSTPLGSG
jgi:hypothetical protein